MNIDQALAELFDALNESMAKCHRCQSGLNKTAEAIRVLADEKVGRMPENDKTAYTRAALAQIAASSIDE